MDGKLYMFVGSVLLLSYCCLFLDATTFCPGPSPNTNLPQNIHERLYRKIPVSATTINNNSTVLTEIFPTDDRVKCAMAANTRHWCHLMCYNEGECKLMALSLPCHHHDDTDDVTDNCFTNLGEFCVVGNTFYEKGEATTIDCAHLTCDGRDMKPSGQAGSNQSCPGDFTFVPQVGCLKIIEETKSYSDASAHCSDLNAQLVVLDDLQSFTDYMDCKSYNRDSWVGILNGKWLDGRDVAPDIWDANQDDVCGYLYRSAMTFYDVDCSGKFPFICQVKEN